MVNLLDEWVPVIKGSEINDDPISPISSKGKEIIQKFNYFDSVRHPKTLTLHN